MLIDAAHPEETRVVVLSGNRLEEFDFETSTKKQIKGNIYLAKVTRVEPSLQAAFVEYGGNRHGFLAFNEIHPDYYRIPVADRQAALAAERAAAEHEEEDDVEGAQEAAPESRVIAPDNGDAIESSAQRAAQEAPAEVARSPFEEPPEGEPAVAEAPAPAEIEPALARAPETFGAESEMAWQEAAPSEAGEPAAAETAAATARAEERMNGGEAIHDRSIETVGGDEIEEATRPRARPFRHYKIQEVIKRRQIMLVQITKEERGNKGAALTTYLSLAGRYCVLMPNTPRGGGVSRKITNSLDRRRLKELVSDLDMPEGMGVIVRTAGSERSKAEIKRDFEYLLRLWDEIRDVTLKSTAPALIYEEGNLIKRSIRDLYARDIEEVVVDGEEGYRTAKAFMKMLMPSHAKRVKLYRDPTVPLLHRFQVESQIDLIHSPIVQLRSGGYIVINPTEALVAIDVNSGRSTKERNIEETALKTNIEAAEEIARQLRLRDLAGLIVIDFIDMEEHRNQAAVERRLKEAMRHDRARIQLGRISPFGLLELSRQRLRPSLLEASTQPCPHCNGTGHIRSTESTALHVLRAIEEEGMRRRSAEIAVAVPTVVALYILNQKRPTLQQSEARYGFHVTITSDDSLVPPAFRLDRVRVLTPAEVAALPAVTAPPPAPEEEEEEEEVLEEEVLPAAEGEAPQAEQAEQAEQTEQAEHAQEKAGAGRRRKRRRRRRGEEGGEARPARPAAGELIASLAEGEAVRPEAAEAPFPERPAPEERHVGQRREAEARPSELRGENGDAGERKRRRRGRRGGRRRRHGERGEGLPQPRQVESAALPQAEIIELIPAQGGDGEAEREMVEAFAAPSSPPVAALATEIVPIAEQGDLARPEPAEPEAPPAPAAAAPIAPEPEQAPAQHNVPPSQEIRGPVNNPRRGWWRR